MTPASDSEPELRRPNRPTLAALGVSLVLATAWAVSGTPSETAAPGVRSDPGAVYNPVVAGEALPDGFRQLLPRDAILPVYDPQFVEAAASGWSPDTDVIGVAVNGEARAYPVSFLNGRELVVDEVGGVPLLVSW